MKELKTRTPEGHEYTYFRCPFCGDEVVNVEQVQDVLARRKIKKPKKQLVDKVKF